MFTSRFPDRGGTKGVTLPGNKGQGKCREGREGRGGERGEERLSGESKKGGDRTAILPGVAVPTYVVTLAEGRFT